ncbi:hypothetical protein BDA96_08G012500 [Sorghum bicolor]|uniref:B30.2/SPRY domain-containing protein n=1 Tax=Sorghum bicolor TaxID=4558 RepID=A0A921QFS8_SORBI|nr:hypothetical protein BDA96_08G012500 [Sorghum bicolor]
MASPSPPPSPICARSMATPSPPPAVQPPSDVTPAPLLPDASASAADAFQKLSLHVTHASLGLETPVDGDDYGGGSCSKPPAPAPKKKTKSKSSKRDENSIWTRSTSRKRKNKKATPQQRAAAAQPWPGAAGAEECAPGQPVLLSRVFKSERILLLADRLTAASSKGYRMVRATHGVAAGAWYFEVKVIHLGSTGHARLGWATNMADIDMPVGCGAYSFGYRDIDGAKVHMSWRDSYGEEGYGEGDVLGFYISLPDGERYEPQVNLNNKGKPFLVQGQDAQAHVPGSKICYFKNGVSQGLAFEDILGGRYYPAASLYTMPNKPNCVVKFNFGPNFNFFPQDFGGLPIPQPMSEVPRQALR